MPSRQLPNTISSVVRCLTSARDGWTRFPADRINNTIEFQLSERPDLDAPGRRRIARAWGIVYLNDDGTEATESTPAPAPPTP